MLTKIPPTLFVLKSNKRVKGKFDTKPDHFVELMKEWELEQKYADKMKLSVGFRICMLCEDKAVCETMGFQI